MTIIEFTAETAHAAIKSGF